MIATCRRLEELNNWHGLQAFIAALQSSLTPENKEVWDKVNPNVHYQPPLFVFFSASLPLKLTLIQERQWFILMRKLFLTADDLRSRVLALPAPCIPVLECYYEALTTVMRTTGPPMGAGDTISVPRLLKVGGTLAEFVKCDPS